MYTVTQYISSAIHDGSLDPKVVLDRYEDIHKAQNIELGLDEEEIYQEAKKADSRNRIMRYILLFPAIYIILGIFKFIEKRYFGIDDLFEMIFPALLLVAIAIYVKQIYINSYIKKLTIKEKGSVSSKNKQNVIISGGFSPFIGYGDDLDSWSFTVNLKKSSALNNMAMNLPQVIQSKN